MSLNFGLGGFIFESRVLICRICGIYRGLFLSSEDFFEELCIFFLGGFGLRGRDWSGLCNRVIMGEWGVVWVLELGYRIRIREEGVMLFN